MGVYDGGPRQGMEGSPGTPSGNDAYDRMTGKGVYYPGNSPAPSSPAAPPPPPPTQIVPRKPPVNAKRAALMAELKNVLKKIFQ